jgi:transglutaminase-like putative cysteine protease
MIYDVRQKTSYSYASKVAYAHHILRLTPVDRVRQRVRASAIDIAPVPVERQEGYDFFGNRLTWIVIEEPHSELSIGVAARIVVEAKTETDTLASPAWEVIRDEGFGVSEIGPLSSAHFLFASRQVKLDPVIRDYARESFAPARPVLDGAADLMRRIKNDFVYEIGATDASTTPTRAFELRRGVCQDFAHVMISGLRGLGVPAAYISGYLRTAPRDGRRVLQGADAMHAWVSVWCGTTLGWVGLDPTNAVFASDDHIVMAVGRDYADVAPLDGVVLASGGQKLDVAVSVIPVAP